jgi:cytochrome c-type biogenesis protein CcmH/NrfG
LLPTVEDKAATLNRLGDTLHRLHKYEDAFIAYKKAKELAPSANPILDRARISILQNSIG